jgi:hypothetical protein
MYCFGCEYELVGLGDDRCPECGRLFDSSDPKSFASEQFMVHRDRRARRFEFALIAVALVPLFANVFGFTSLIIARYSLGRWPYRGGRDDPSYVPGVGLIGAAAILLVIASLPALIAGLALVLALMTQEAWRRLLRSGILAVGLWACGFALTRWDPAEVWMWLWD